MVASKLIVNFDMVGIIRKIDLMRLVSSRVGRSIDQRRTRIGTVAFRRIDLPRAGRVLKRFYKKMRRLKILFAGGVYETKISKRGEILRTTQVVSIPLIIRFPPRTLFGPSEWKNCIKDNQTMRTREKGIWTREL